MPRRTPIDEFGNILLFKKRKQKRKKTRMSRYSWPQKMALLDCYDKLIERGNEVLYACNALHITPMLVNEWRAARIFVAQQQAIRDSMRHHAS